MCEGKWNEAIFDHVTLYQSAYIGIFRRNVVYKCLSTQTGLTVEFGFIGDIIRTQNRSIRDHKTKVRGECTPMLFMDWLRARRTGPGLYTRGKCTIKTHSRQIPCQFISHAFVKEVYLMYTARNTRGCASSNEARALLMRR